MEPRPQTSFIESDGQESESDGNVYIKHLFWKGGGFSPPQKKTYNPPNGCQIMCSNSFFFDRAMNYNYIAEYSLMDNKHRKLFVTGQSKGRKFHTFCTVTGGNYCKFQKLNK